MTDYNHIKTYTICAVILTIFLWIASCGIVQAEEFIPDTEYKVNQLADAIFRAEGGYKTNFPYGIKSVRCNNEQECRRICKNTIRNNITRYENSTTNDNSSYLQFLQSRFAPTTGNITSLEKSYNVSWLKNVKWFLENPREI